MRIAVATWTGRLAGGVETYLAALIPALMERGHPVALLHEVDDPVEREPVAPGVRQWCVADAGEDASLEALAEWKPDVIFAQGCENPALERRLAAVAPTVFFAHAYRGTCISGTKSLAARGHATCARRLGWACLAHYLPDRCGGRSPVTMVTMFRREVRRRNQLSQYAAVVAFSEHIRSEYIRHGVPPDRVHRLPCHVPLKTSTEDARSERHGVLPSRIVFVGRMEALKGGDVLLDALPQVQNELGRPLHVSFVGDGRERTNWEQRGRELCRTHSTLQIEFPGWIAADARTRLLARTDLLVVPSLWPEPFGLIGLEAAACGVPAAGFDAGGIREWLRHGVSGCLAPARHPRVAHLAAAMVECLRDRSTHEKLSRGALEVASHHSMRAHVASLLDVFAGVVTPASNVHTDPAA